MAQVKIHPWFSFKQAGSLHSTDYSYHILTIAKSIQTILPHSSNHILGPTISQTPNREAEGLGRLAFPGHLAIDRFLQKNGRPHREGCPTGTLPIHVLLSFDQNPSGMHKHHQKIHIFRAPSQNNKVIYKL